MCEYLMMWKNDTRSFFFLATVYLSASNRSGISTGFSCSILASCIYIHLYVYLMETVFVEQNRNIEYTSEVAGGVLSYLMLNRWPSGQLYII